MTDLKNLSCFDLCSANTAWRKGSYPDVYLNSEFLTMLGDAALYKVLAVVSDEEGDDPDYWTVGVVLASVREDGLVVAFSWYDGNARFEEFEAARAAFFEKGA